MAFYVQPKHGEAQRHDGIVDALDDILDCYLDERTGIAVWADEVPPAGALVWSPTAPRRIVGPNRVEC